MQANKFVPASTRPAMQHYLGGDVPSSGIIHTSFRVQLHEVPRWLRRNHNNGGFAASEGYTGEGFEFTYTRYNRDTGEPYKFTGHLHSASLDKASFADRVLVDAYWERIQTQKGYRAVITFWWRDNSVNAQADTVEAEQALRSLFGALAAEVWDYMELYDNPTVEKAEANLALVFKGASKGKPMQHTVSMDDQPLSEVSGEVLDSQVLEDLFSGSDVETPDSTPRQYGDMLGIVCAAREIEDPRNVPASASTAFGEKLAALLGK